MKVIWGFLLICCLMLSITGMAQDDVDFTGDYHLTGMDENDMVVRDTSFTIEAIESTAGRFAVTHWLTNERPGTDGVGLQRDHVFAEIFPLEAGTTTNCTIEVFSRLDDGTMVGIWTGFDEAGIGVNHWVQTEASTDFAGEYELAVGVNPDGALKASGTMTVTPEEDDLWTVILDFVNRQGDTLELEGHGFVSEDVLAIVTGTPDDLNNCGISVITMDEEGNVDMLTYIIGVPLMVDAGNKED